MVPLIELDLPGSLIADGHYETPFTRLATGSRIDVTRLLPVRRFCIRPALRDRSFIRTALVVRKVSLCLFNWATISACSSVLLGNAAGICLRLVGLMFTCCTAGVANRRISI